MDYTTLGRTGLKVSRLCLGTMNFGPFATEADSFALMDQALEQGINFFDTADVYGGKRGERVTEHILGRWFAQGGGRREKVVLATKVYGGMGDWPNQSRLSAAHIRRGCDESLRALRTDHIDLYQMHHIDRDTPWEELWQAFGQLIQAGKITYVGTSNFPGWAIAQGNCLAAQRHLLGIVSEQSRYNLTVRTIELEVIPACQRFGVGLIPYAPLAGGLLGGALAGLKEGRRGAEALAKEIEQRRPQLERYEALCRQLGEKPAERAQAWLLAQPAVTAPIIGPRTREQLAGSLRAFQVTLAPETRTQLDEIWPGPGGPAPEAYAW